MSTYVEEVIQEKIEEQWNKLYSVQKIDSLGVFFGYGDHGGGFTKEMVKKGIELSKKDGYEVFFNKS